jgi:hypothetical protein
LRLEFAFGLGAGPRKCHVVAAYCPETAIAWHDENHQRVEFYPFLVVTEDVKKPHDRAIWLPYWHLHFKKAGVHRKYGQWAPHMDVGTFTDLVERAKRGGHI